MATASTLVARTFTPLAGGQTQVIAETPSAHTKPNSVWNRLKRSLQTVQLSAKKFGTDETRVRSEDGNFWKLNAANEYIGELEKLIEASGGKDAISKLPTELKSVAELSKENQLLKTKIAELETKQPAPSPFSSHNATSPSPTGWSPRNPQPGDPCDHKLLGLYEALYGEANRKQMELLAGQNKIAVETQAKRRLNYDGIKVVGLDLSDIAAQYGEPEEVTGMRRIQRANLQKKADDFVVQLNAPKSSVELQTQPKTPKRAPDLIGLSAAVLGENEVERLKVSAMGSGRSREDILKIQLASKALKIPGVDLSKAEAFLGADWPNKVQRWDRETAQKKADKFVAETCF